MDHDLSPALNTTVLYVAVFGLVSGLVLFLLSQNLPLPTESKGYYVNAATFSGLWAPSDWLCGGFFNDHRLEIER
jgi:hypothetical protein